jgi:hypothetical protein
MAPPRGTAPHLGSHTGRLVPPLKFFEAGVRQDPGAYLPWGVGARPRTVAVFRFKSGGGQEAVSFVRNDSPKPVRVTDVASLSRAGEVAARETSSPDPC